MNKIFKISFILIVVLLAGIWFFGRGESGENQNVARAMFEVKALAEDVLLKASGKENFAIISNSTTTQAGGELRTSESGRAVVSSPNESITVVDSNTEMTLAIASQEGTRIKLEAGKLWSRIGKTLEQGEFYEIETDEVLAAVRGTSFGTERVGTTTVITVVEGEVTLFHKDRRGEISEDRKDTIRAGAKVLINRNDLPRVSDVTSEDRMDEWFIFNNPQINEESTTEPRTEIQSQTDIQPQTSTETDNSVPVVETKFVIYRVSPDNITISETENVVIWGEGFTGARNVFVGSEPIIEFIVLRDDAIQFRSSEVFDDGIFDVRVVNRDGKSFTLTEALTVNDPSPTSDPVDDPNRDPQYIY